MADSLMLNDVPDTFLKDDRLKMETDNLSSDDNIASTKITILNSNPLKSNDVENILSPQHQQQLLDDVDVIDSLLEKPLTSIQNEDFKINVDEELKMEIDYPNSADDIVSTGISILNSNLLSSNDVNNVTNSLSPQHKHELNDIEINDCALEKSITSNQNENFKVNVEDLKMKTDNLNSDDNIASTKVKISNSDSLSSNDVENVVFPQHKLELMNNIEVDDSLLEKSITSEQNEDCKVNVDEEFQMEMDNPNSAGDIVSTGISILNSNLLSNNDVNNVTNSLSPQHKHELNNTEVNDCTLEKSITSNQNENFKVNVEELKMKMDNLNSDDNIASTKISIESNSNDVTNLLTPQHEPELNDTEVDNSLLENSKTNGEYENFKVGDIIWAKIGKYPFWPSVICIDPQSKIFIKEVKKKNMLHVRFCNDKGRRSWTKTIENYYGKSNLFSKYPNCLSYIKNSKNLMNSWNLAVEEADYLLTLNGEKRMFEFFKTFLNLDNVNNLPPSALINSSEEAVTTMKVRTYSRKRSLALPEQDNDSKIIKTENISVNGSTSSKSIDIPLLSRSDDADSTVSDISLNYVYMRDMSSKMKKETAKKRRSTKTYPPKSSFTDKYDLSDSMGTSPEYTDDNSLLSDNHDEMGHHTTMATTTRRIPEKRKLEISILEGVFEQDNIHLHHSRRSSAKTMTSKSSSNSKETAAKQKSYRKKSSTGRRSTTVKSESSPELTDATESEASSKNEPHTSVFLASTKNKQLFVKTLKRACVVCKNIEDTVKCMGPCQSFFHKECLANSEKRYHKNEPFIKSKKKNSRSKKNSSKSTFKSGDFNTNDANILHNTNEEICANKIHEKNDVLLSQSINSIEQCSSNTNEDDKSHQSISNNLFIDKNCDVTENEIIQGLMELESMNEDSVQETSEDKIVETSVKSLNMTDEKEFKDDLKYMCSLCKANKTNCFVCGLDIEDPEQKIVCKLFNCGKYYHEKCLEDWPQCQWTQGSRNNIRCVVCPHHVCHLCISDNPKSSCKTHFPAEKLTRCIKCPTAYHRSEYCLPAGSQVLSYSDIICSRHFEPKTLHFHYNATWCFICTLGGALICCDLCPSSFHIECLNQNPSDFVNGFTCEECQTGRYPLYGEIVWVKIGTYRWWPAQIIFPNQVPDTLNAIPHSVGQFPVRFFGSYDYYWVNRGRVFNFQEGDDENILIKSKMKSLDQVFQDAIIEAAQAHNAYVLDKDKNDAIVAKKSLTKPPKYIRIKFNRPIGLVKNMELDITPMTPCECNPNNPNPCGPGSDCINRMLMFECQPLICPAGDKCNNQRFEKTLYPAMVPFLTKGRGWGLKTLENIKEGSFVIEYVGDVIDEDEFQRRCLEMHKRNEQNYYFLTIDNSRMIDAGPKGNLSRFMNHSCEPNCVTQKWTVNGDTRIGLFALHDIEADTELVFDYRLQSCSGVEKRPCQCGASRCSRFIGVKVEEEKKKVITINDNDKCKVSTKNKRKPLKIKDNVSDLDKSKLSKILNNDKNISTIENGVDMPNAEKMDDSKKSKAKVSISKSLSASKNENSESSETHSEIKKIRKSPNRNSSNMTKDDTTTHILSLEESVNLKRKLGNNLSTIPSKKQLIKDDISDTGNMMVVKRKRQGEHLRKKNVIEKEIDLLSLSRNTTELKSVTLRSYGKKANEIKPDKSTETQERSRHKLTRLAKSRHSFLSKNDMDNKNKNESPTTSKRKFNKEIEQKKNKTKIVKKKKKVENNISLLKTVTLNKNKINKHSLLFKTYYKNDSCLICGKGHTELTCKNKKCPRVFHLSCMNKSRIFKSGFICPSHFCSVCKKRKVVAKCKFCVESFCTSHVKGNIFKDPLGNGMLCTTHHPYKKSLPIAAASTSVIPDLNVINEVTSKNTEPIVFVDSSPSIGMTDDLLDIDEDQLNVDMEEINKEDYMLTQVIKDECDREYIHIGGFNVCNMSDLVTDQGESYTILGDTDGDLFKPSSANVVIDIESASALYQSTGGNVQLMSIASDNKDSNDYATVHFIPDPNQTKNKWLAAEP